MFRTFVGCFICLVVSSATAFAADITEIRYSGSMSQVRRDGDDLILRRFEVVVLNADGDQFFSVLDDDADGCPWPESYGRFAAANGPRPHLVYEYEGNVYSHLLPPLVLELPEDIAEQKSWTNGHWSYTANGRPTVDGQPAWAIQISGRRGRRGQLVVEENGLLQTGQQDVFMGQGVKFRLSVERASSRECTGDETQKLTQLQAKLLTLQSVLGRQPDTQRKELIPRQIEAANSQLDELSAIAKGTSLQETVFRIRRDVTRQDQRVAQTMERQKQLLNQSAPEFSLNLVTGGTLGSESLKGNVVVLHFWKYAEKPLAEPYGQVGYLEFLSGKRRDSNVKVVGVAMNQSLRQADRVRAGTRTARKLIEFMNLTYPVGYDDGGLLRQLGDPRESGGQLPLWVVISPEGKIVHYRSGFYEVDQRLGLKDLDAVVAAVAGQ